MYKTNLALLVRDAMNFADHASLSQSDMLKHGTSQSAVEVKVQVGWIILGIHRQDDIFIKLGQVAELSYSEFMYLPWLE